MHLRPEQLLIAAALLGACGGPDPVPLKIEFVLGTEPEHNCAYDTCADYAMGCGATLGIRVVDVDSGEVLAGDCVLVPPPAESPTLCGVDAVEGEIDLGDLPVGMAQLQVAIARPPADSEPLACGESMFQFDLQGNPLPLPTEPAFAGAVYVDIGARATVQVPLACPDPGQLNAPSCLPARQQVEVLLDDMRDVDFVRFGSTAAGLTVGVGEPIQDTSVDPPVWVLGPLQSDQIDLVDLSIPARWQGDDIGAFESFGCVLVTPGTPQPITTVHCTADPSIDPIDGHVELRGVYLPDESSPPGRDVFAQLLDAAIAADVIDAFPPAGMVIGRVVDGGQGLAGVTVSAEPSGSTVRYFTDDGAGTLVGVDSPGANVTHANGYFMSLNAPFGTRWTAMHGDGRREIGIHHAGLIANKLSLVLIRMGNP